MHICMVNITILCTQIMTVHLSQHGKYKIYALSKKPIMHQLQTISPDIFSKL